MHLSIGLQSEYVLSLFGLRVTNTMLTSLLATVVLFFIALAFQKQIEKPKSFIIRGVMLILRQWLTLINQIINDEKLARDVFPLIATFFLFIFASNLLALIPGFLGSFYVVGAGGVRHSVLRSPNSDLTTTLALAIISVGATQYFSMRKLGTAGFLKRFFNFINPLAFIIGFFELLGEFVKIISFSFRLFGNMFAGEVLLLVAAFFLPYFVPIPFMILELFVGLIQAFIFAVLTLSFIARSTVSVEKGGAL